MTIGHYPFCRAIESKIDGNINLFISEEKERIEKAFPEKKYSTVIGGREGALIKRVFMAQEPNTFRFYSMIFNFDDIVQDTVSFGIKPGTIALGVAVFGLWPFLGRDMTDRLNSLDYHLAVMP